MSGEGDCLPDIDPGDLILTISIEENKNFKREGNDLYYHKEITSLEA